MEATETSQSKGNGTVGSDKPFIVNLFVGWAWLSIASAIILFFLFDEPYGSLNLSQVISIFSGLVSFGISMAIGKGLHYLFLIEKNTKKLASIASDK